MSTALQATPTSPTESADCLRIRGARTHNLKNIDLDVPHRQLVVITGPSGCGKSSLAFDTLFAEGQRQYIESLSVYARQFLNELQRPDVDEIDGLQPVISIDQRPGATNPRSTVGTSTEIYDYLRLLFARVGEVSCHVCGQPIRQQSIEQIETLLMSLPEGTKLMLLAPLVRGRKGQHAEVFEQIRKAGQVRVRVDGTIYDLDAIPPLDGRKPHTIESVVDRIVVRPGSRSRLAESLQLAVNQGDGVVIASYAASIGEWIDQLFSTQYACPNCQRSLEEIEPRTFSFNSPYGACPQCSGLGYQLELDPELQQEYATATSAARRLELEAMREHVTCPACHGARLRPEALAVRIAGKNIAEVCGLSLAAAHEFFDDLRQNESFSSHELGTQYSVLRTEETRAIAAPILSEVTARLSFLLKVGLHYLTLDRASDTLSGGELQRVRLATGIGSGLAGICYILDEPSIGLHPRDNQRLIDALRDLLANDNTVLVVEHDEAMMRQADWLIDMGPGAGSRGGQVMATGTGSQIMANPASITGRYLSGQARIEIPTQRRQGAKTDSLMIEGVTTNNLKNVTAVFPLGLLIGVTGVSGSGKSSLVNETLAPALIRKLGGVAPKPGLYTALRGADQIDKVIQIDQSPIGRSPRSNAATYTGVFDEIRKVFAATKEAKQLGFKASRFSFNVAGGRCEECQGQGTKRLEMNFLPDLFVPCPACEGKRFNPQTLVVRFKGLSIADVLELPVEEALRFFENVPAIHRSLSSLADVGLGYLPLGQSSTTLSGGESQRIKLATELARTDTGQTLYLLDEPTTGLHFDDIRLLLGVLQRLVDRGNTVIVIEHNLDVLKCCDHLIDLGPDGGEAGGYITATGTPEEIAALDSHVTGRYLREALAAGR